MSAHMIDVWDTKTLDADISDALNNNRQQIKDYFDTGNAIVQERENSDHRTIERKNEFSARQTHLTQTLCNALASRTIRAWHYARLTENEAAGFTQSGISLSTIATFRQRLNALVSDELLSRETAEIIFADSPLSTPEQHEIRANRFWTISHPLPINDGGVRDLLRYWGGEVASMCQKDQEVLRQLAQIGRPRIIEAAIPLTDGVDANSAAEAILASFGKDIGCATKSIAFDLCVMQPLPASAVLDIISEGDPDFLGLGEHYPPGFKFRR